MQLFKGAKVLNPRKGWDGKKIIDLSYEEMHNLKSSTDAKKTPSGSGTKGKIAEMLLNVSEVKRHDMITDPSTEISTKPLAHEQEQSERKLTNVKYGYRYRLLRYRIRPQWEIYIRLPTQIRLCLSNKNACFVIKEEYSLKFAKVLLP